MRIRRAQMRNICLFDAYVCTGTQQRSWLPESLALCQEPRRGNREAPRPRASPESGQGRAQAKSTSPRPGGREDAGEASWRRWHPSEILRHGSALCRRSRRRSRWHKDPTARTGVTHGPAEVGRQAGLSWGLQSRKEFGGKPTPTRLHCCLQGVLSGEKHPWPPPGVQGRMGGGPAGGLCGEAGLLAVLGP